MATNVPDEPTAPTRVEEDVVDWDGKWHKLVPIKCRRNPAHDKPDEDKEKMHFCPGCGRKDSLEHIWIVHLPRCSEYQTNLRMHPPQSTCMPDHIWKRPFKKVEERNWAQRRTGMTVMVCQMCFEGKYIHLYGPMGYGCLANRRKVELNHWCKDPLFLSEKLPETGQQE